MTLPLLRRLLCLALCACLLMPAVASAQLLPSAPAEEEAATEAAPEAPAAETLLEILRDEQSLAALIEQLERAAEGEPLAEAEEAPPPAPASIGRRIALVTQGIAQGVAARLEVVGSAIDAAPNAFEGIGEDEIAVLFQALRNLFLTIVVTAAVFVVLRRIAIPIYRRMGERAQNRSMIQAGLIGVGAGVADVVIVLLAWALGYLVALLVFGEFGQIALRQTLYLNAFLAVEMIKVALRLVLAPSSWALRPVPLGDTAARYLNRRAAIIFSVLGYGHLLVVPIVGDAGAFAAQRATGTLISAATILYLAWLVVRNRHAVAEWILAQTRPAPRPVVSGQEEDAFERDSATLFGDPVEEDAAAPPTRRPLAPLAQAWHWVALLYLLAMLLVVLSQPPGVVFAALGASLKVVLALIFGVMLSGTLARAAQRGVHVPPRLSERLPRLELRLNQFIPRVLTVLRAVILLVVAIYVIDTLALLPLRDWVTSETGLRVTGALVTVALVLLAAFVVWLLMTSWVEYRLNPEGGALPTSREQTLFTLLRNAGTIALVILTLMFCLSEIGLNIGPLIASAGVLGLAIGFGAQKMVQDIITGIFIQFENAINVGDVVTAGGITGVVERLTVRSVSLRDLQGVYHIIPFSSVDTVSNYMRDFSNFVLDMSIAYREDVEEARVALFDAYEELRRHPEEGGHLLGDLEWFGLEAFADSAVVVRARIRTLPGKQWSVGRAYNQIVKRIFDERGIEIPFPHQTIYFGENKDGSAPPLHLTGGAGSAAEDASS